MSSTHILIGAIAFVLVGAILSYLRPGDPTAGALIVAGTTMLTGAVVASRSQAAAAKEQADIARERALAEQRRADDAVSQTQVLQRKLDGGSRD